MMTHDDYEDMLALVRALSAKHGPHYYLTDHLTGKDIDVTGWLAAFLDLAEVEEDEDG